MELNIVIAAVILAVACSGGKAKAVEDGHAAVTAGSAAPTQPTGYRVDPSGAKGDVQVRVEWHDVPTVARAAAPERTACGTTRTPAVAPTTTWGIPDVFVMIEIDHGKPLGDPQVRVTLDHCAVTPRAVVAGTTLAITSAADAPARLTLERAAPGPGHGSGAAAPEPARPIALPIAGHEVVASLDRGSSYALAFDRHDGAAKPDRASGTDDPVWIVAATTPYVAITEANGQVVLRDVPVGTYGVTAWLPARGGQTARTAHGSATVAAGVLAEVTIDLAPSGTPP